MEEDGDNYSQMQELGTHHQPLQAGAQADQVDLDVVYKPAAQAAPLKSHDLAQTWWLVTRDGATNGQLHLEPAGRMWTTWGLGEWGLVMEEDGQIVCTMVLGTTQYKAILHYDRLENRANSNCLPPPFAGSLCGRRIGGKKLHCGSGGG